MPQGVQDDLFDPQPVHQVLELLAHVVAVLGAVQGAGEHGQSRLAGAVGEGHLPPLPVLGHAVGQVDELCRFWRGGEWIVGQGDQCFRGPHAGVQQDDEEVSELGARDVVRGLRDREVWLDCLSEVVVVVVVVVVVAFLKVTLVPDWDLGHEHRGHFRASL